MKTSFISPLGRDIAEDEFDRGPRGRSDTERLGNEISKRIADPLREVGRGDSVSSIHLKGGRGMKRRIVLVALPWARDNDPQQPLGHASLLAALKREDGLDACSIVQAVNDRAFTEEALARDILSLVTGMPPDLTDVAVGAYVWNDRQVGDLLKALRSHGFQGRIILGGPQISYARSGLEETYPQVDVFIRGAGEAALCVIALTNGRPRIPGIHYAEELDACEQSVADFEHAPSPWLDGVYQTNDQERVSWETQRGCNFRCSFCQHRQPDARIPVVTLPAQRITSEINLFCQAKVNQIAVLDPVFNMRSSHAIPVLHQFTRAGFQGELSLQCRAEMINDEFLDAAQPLNVCLEFGLQTIHAREYLAVGRRNDMPKITKILREVQRRKIRHEVSLIYGLPEQTLASFKETVSWCLAMEIPVIKAFPLLLLRGTLLEQTGHQWSLTVKDSGLPMVIGSNTFNFEDWQEMGRLADALSCTEEHHPSRLGALLKTYNGHTFNASNCEMRSLGKMK